MSDDIARARAGCCTDRLHYEKYGTGSKGCTSETCMILPEGKTCGLCVHIARCKAMFGHTESDTYCDWFPRRFDEAQFLPILMHKRSIEGLLSAENPKTQTRRLVKGWPSWATEIGRSMFTPRGQWSFRGNHPEDGPAEKFTECPYGKPGDFLYVRERWAAGKRWDGLSPKQILADPNLAVELDEFVENMWFEVGGIEQEGRGRWRQSIHMPRVCSRIWLRVLRVRVERVQDISDADARAEGCYDADEYSVRWDEIHGNGAWTRNPWVWVIEFTRAKRPIFYRADNGRFEVRSLAV